MRKTILLIEEDLDEQLVARMAVSQLKSKLTLSIVTDTREAISYLKSIAAASNFPSLILLEPVLPLKTGHDFLLELSQITDPQVSQIPIYALSHDVNFQNWSASHKSSRPFKGFIPKPLNSIKLESLMELRLAP